MSRIRNEGRHFNAGGRYFEVPLRMRLKRQRQIRFDLQQQLLELLLYSA